MKSSTKTATLEQIRSPLLVVAAGELDRQKLPPSLKGLDVGLDGEITRVIQSGDFKGKRDQTALLYPKRGSDRVLLVGLGRVKEISRGAIRRGAAIAGRRARAASVPSLAFHVLAETQGGVAPVDIGQVVVEGVVQGAWQFTEFKSTDVKNEPLDSLEIITTKKQRSGVEKGRKVGSAIASGQHLARNLQALPGNVCTPSYLGKVARKLGRTHEHKVTVFARAQIEKAGFTALSAVAQGSHEDPRFIVLEYQGGGRQAPLGFVGKGVTFDSGGISIKPALHMEEMKYDMSGAAAVLGLFETLGVLKPKVNVVGLIPATENLPSGTAVKPGDIIRTHQGKTIEVVNTDAEGRLILVDALSYVRRFKPACVLDAATLTGAVVIALGNHAIGLMGNDDKLVEEVTWAGDLAGERCWPLPLWDEYREQIRSDVADVKNTGGREGGSITAGWFLREFVDGFPWAHLDIAGTAYTNSDRPDLAKGPTGVAVRLFTQFVLGRATG